MCTKRTSTKADMKQLPWRAYVDQMGNAGVIPFPWV